MMTKTSDEMVTTTFKLPAEDLKKFDAVAVARRTSRAALMRESMLDKIAQYERTTQEVKA